MSKFRHTDSPTGRDLVRRQNSSFRVRSWVRHRWTIDILDYCHIRLLAHPIRLFLSDYFCQTIDTSEYQYVTTRTHQYTADSVLHLGLILRSECSLSGTAELAATAGVGNKQKNVCTGTDFIFKLSKHDVHSVVHFKQTTNKQMK